MYSYNAINAAARRNHVTVRAEGVILTLVARAGADSAVVSAAEERRPSLVAVHLRADRPTDKPSAMPARRHCQAVPVRGGRPADEPGVGRIEFRPTHITPSRGAGKRGGCGPLRSSIGRSNCARAEMV